MTAEVFFFWVLAACTIGSAIWVIIARNPIASAMALVGTFFFLAGIYVLLLAHTIAVLQVLVYAGAIMVLFLFVIMLLSLNEPEHWSLKFNLPKAAGGAAAFGLLFLLAGAVWKLPYGKENFGESTPTFDVEKFGTLKHLGSTLYTQYLLPFEVVSLLLLVAIVGAVVVAKPRI